MKKSQVLMLAAVLVVSLSANSQEVYKALVQTTAVETNDSGGLSYSRYGNKQIVQQAAETAGITNLSGLHLVYDKTADQLQVVMGTNNTVVATPISFVDSVSLSKTNGTVVERLAWVFLGTNTTASGTLRATERSHFGTNDALLHFTLNGQLQFAAPAEGTNSAVIYSGSIIAGSSEFEGEGGQGEHGGQGEQGAQGWQGGQVERGRRN
jgi:hypothetical protein